MTIQYTRTFMYSDKKIMSYFFYDHLFQVLEFEPKEEKFDRLKMEDLLKQKFFYDIAFSLYGGKIASFQVLQLLRQFDSLNVSCWFRMVDHSLLFLLSNSVNQPQLTITSYSYLQLTITSYGQLQLTITSYNYLQLTITYIPGHSSVSNHHVLVYYLYCRYCWPV